MFSRARIHLTYANVVSTVCLFIVLGGSAYAAHTIGSKQIQDGSIQGKDIKNNSIDGRDVKNKSLSTADFKPGGLPAGAPGARGATGAPGAPATRLFAAVAGETGNLAYGRGVVSTTRTGVGQYTVTFNQSLAGCVRLATPGFGSPTADGDISLGGTEPVKAKVDNSSSPSAVNVSVSTDGGLLMDNSVQVAVLC
jgi:hypothetical protein